METIQLVDKQRYEEGLYFAKTEEGLDVALKVGVKASEALIHSQLYRHFQESDLAEMVPRFISSTLASDGTVDVVMERISGKTLSDSFDSLSNEETRDMLIVLHYFLERAHSELGFTHGDLVECNIILRREEGKEWHWDIALSDGRKRSITLPFCPTIIDFEHSSFDYGSTYFDTLPLYFALLGKYYSDERVQQLIYSSLRDPSDSGGVGELSHKSMMDLLAELGPNDVVSV
jgi:serine/threonine protein kinase